MKINFESMGSSKVLIDFLVYSASHPTFSPLSSAPYLWCSKFVSSFVLDFIAELLAFHCSILLISAGSFLWIVVLFGPFICLC